MLIMTLLQTLFVISGLGILVRFISNLASGDLLCIVNDLSDNKTNLDIRSFKLRNCVKTVPPLTVLYPDRSTSVSLPMQLRSQDARTR